MSQYLKLFKTHEEYDENQEKPIVSHCIKEVHVHKDNSFNYGSDDTDPDEDDYDLDAGYFD